MGSIFGGGTQKTSQSSTTEPWGPQQGPIQNAYGYAQNAYNSSSAMGPYGGQYVAGPNDYQTQAEQFAGNYGNGVGAQAPGQVAATGSTLMGQATPYVNNAGGIAANGIGGPNAGLYGTLQGYGTGATRTPGASPELSSALNSSAVNGATALNGFTNNLSSLAGTAASDPTARIAQDASTYANNPGVQSAINSANAQIQQTLHEQTVPGLNRAAEAGGSLNSSRAGAAEAGANEGAAIAQGNADSSILNNAYNTGMGTAAGLYSSGLNTGVNANTSGLFDVGMNTSNEANRQIGQNEFNTSAELGAANSGLNTGLNYGLGNANTRLAANGQLGSATGLGLGAASEAGNLASGNASLLAGAGGLYQSGQQAGDTNALDQYQGNYQFPWQNLDNYFNIVGKPQGQTTNSTGTQQNSGPGVLGGIAGLASGAAGLFGSGGAFPAALPALLAAL